MTQDLRGTLNPHQQRRLRVTCEYIDKTLADIEALLHASAAHSPFQKHIGFENRVEQRGFAGTHATEYSDFDLPRCDLGVVLIDAASGLTPNDLANHSDSV